jgi:hypothetical protein
MLAMSRNESLKKSRADQRFDERSGSAQHASIATRRSRL